MADVLDALLQQMYHLELSVRSDVASLALFIYDWQLTLGDEINMIWNAEAKLGKVLFLWIRYFGIASHAFRIGAFLLKDPSPTFCNAATKVQIVSPNILWWSVELVFALRVWILYRRSRKLLIFLSVMYIGSIAASVVLLGTTLVHTRPAPLPRGLPISGCFAIVPDSTYEPIILGIITTSTLCVLTVYRAMQGRKDGLSSSPLFSLFLRDGLMYYFSVNVTFLVNLFLFRYGSSPIKPFFNGFLDAIPCMFGARVLINILSLVRKTSGGGLGTTLPPLSDPRFVRPNPAAPGGYSGIVGISTTIEMNDMSGTTESTVESGPGTVTSLKEGQC